MNFKALSQVWVITRRELRDQLRDWRIIIPMFILTVFFPYLMNWTAGQAITFTAEYGAELVGERFIPFLLMVVGFFPLTISMVIALEAFVGEKERGTIEPLLSSPLEDWQIYLGKLLAAAIVPLFSSYLAISVYLFGLLRQGIPLPSGMLLGQTLALTTVQGLLMVSSAIVISAQSTTVRSANLLSSFIIIPVALLLQGESVLMFWGNNFALWLAVVGISVVTGLIIRVGLVHFKREHLLGREIDSLNIKWGWQTFASRFSGGHGSFWSWYRVEILKVLKSLKLPLLITLAVSLMAATAAFYWGNLAVANISEGLSIADFRDVIDASEIDQVFDVPLTFTGILANNVRATLIMLLAGAFTFSVGGTVILLINVGLVGGIFGVISALGLPSWDFFLAGILPHGIFELPALILSAAAILNMGVQLVTPNARQTFLQIYVQTLADWAKLFVGVILPALILAALIETYLTPQLLGQLMLQYLP